MEARGADRARTAQKHFIDLCRCSTIRRPSRMIRSATISRSRRARPRPAAAKAGPMSGRRAISPGNTRRRNATSSKAIEQLTRYAAALENPPLHVACDTHIFRIETRWTNEVPAKYEFELDDLADPVNLARLRAVFHNPEELRSRRTRAKLTKEAADKFQAISDCCSSAIPTARRSRISSTSSSSASSPTA